MNEIKLLNIEIDENSHSLHYFKSKDGKLWFSLSNIDSIINKYYNLSYSDVFDFCKKFGKLNVCRGVSVFKTSKNEFLYVKELETYETFIDFSTIVKLANEYSDMISYGKFDKLRDAIRDSFDELRAEVTEEEIERRIEAVKKEIDSICKLQKANKNKKK